MFRTTLKLDLFLPPPCFWETGTRRVVTSKAERQLSVYIYDSLYPLLTRFSQILNGFCFINVENRSTLKMSSTSSDYDAKCETDGSAFYVTDPLDPSPLATRPWDSMTAKFPTSSGHRKISIWLNRKLFAQKYFKKHKLLFKWKRNLGVRGTLKNINVCLKNPWKC